jgi:hypothetical protein
VPSVRTRGEDGVPGELGREHAERRRVEPARAASGGDGVEHVAVETGVERLDRARERRVHLAPELRQLGRRERPVGGDHAQRGVPRHERGRLAGRDPALELWHEGQAGAGRPGRDARARPLPSRATTAPSAFTTVNTASRVPSTVCAAAPCPAGSPCS